jgi:hydrogenase maturation protease
MTLDDPSAPVRSDTVLVLGVGNTLMTDDGAGPAVIAALAASGARAGVRLIDGGTCGLTLLPEIEACAALIVVDAALIDGPAGRVETYEGAAMDALLRSVKSTAHEVAMTDLLDGARALGALPERRALVAVKPARIAVGLAPTPEIAAALPEAQAAVEALLARWLA